MYRRHDTYYRRAKEAGYRSRAAYKLLELSRKYRLIRRGDHVVDLGAWPGSWMQVAAKLVGPAGRVVGVDLVTIDPFDEPHAVSLVGDLREPKIIGEVLRELGRPPSVVLSDMAPKLTGIRATDEAACADLSRLALDIALRTLAPDGRLLVKVFASEQVRDLLAAARPFFKTVKITRPSASRGGSSESYLVALDFRSGKGPAGG